MTGKHITGRFVAVIIAFLCAGGVMYLTLAAPGSQLWQLRFNPYAVLSGVGVIVNTALFLYVVGRQGRTEEHTWMAVYLLLAVIYSSGELFTQLSANPQAAEFWANLGIVAVFLGPILYLFTLSYTNESERRYSGTVAIVLASALIFCYIAVTTNTIFINTPNPFTPFPWGYSTASEGPGGLVYAAYFESFFILSFVRLINFRRHSRNPILRRQAALFIFAISIPAFVAIGTDVILPAIIGDKLPALGGTLTVVSGAVLVYGLMRYQLLTINPTLFSHAVLGIMEEAVAATDDKFNVVYLNPNAEKLLGIKVGPRQQRTLLKSFTALSATKFQNAFTKAHGATVSIDQLDISHGQGNSIPVRLNASQFRMGQIDTWVMAMSDITAELQTRSVIEHEVQVRTKELHEARAYLISSINSLEQGFILINQHSKVELLNRQASRLLSVNGEVDHNKPATELLRVAGWDADLGKVVERALATRRSRRIDIAAESGSFYAVYVTPILSDEQVFGATIIIQDVTEQKILDRSKDEFFSIASHELRTPLTAIRGNMSMVKDYYADSLKDPSLKGLIDDSHAASVRLIEIVNDFLDSSSLEQGKMVFNIAPVMVAQLVGAVQKDLSVLSQQQHNEMKGEGLDNLPMVMADEARLRQILYNLLSNANKYSENATITVSGVAQGDNLRLRITDTGKGISPENQKLLFHKFQQAGDSILTRDNTKGTGLGLYISKLLATNMHGTVELEHTEVGKGTTFAIILPVATKADKERAAKQATAAQPLAAS